MPSVDISVDINLYSVKCESCRAELDVADFTVDSDGDITMTINPCDICMDEKFNEGVIEGEENSVTEAKDNDNPYK